MFFKNIMQNVRLCTFHQVMTDYAVWIHIFRLHNKAKFAQNIFVRSHFNKSHLYLSLGRKKQFCLTIIPPNIVPN
jgi:hypothetical protein